jgi:hypothetical protein
MTRNRSFWWAMFSCTWLLSPACESSEQIGSACKHGVCPQAITPSSELCAAVEASVSLGVTNAFIGTALKQLGAICLPSEPRQSSDGTVECTVEWTIPQPPEDFAIAGEPAPVDCNDAPFLSPAPAAAEHVCEMRQLTSAQRDAGEDGWFLNTHNDECRSDAQASVTFSLAARPSNGTRIDLRCLEAHVLEPDADASAAIEPVPIAECSSLPSRPARGIGAGCVPQLVPEHGFDPRQRVLEIGSRACTTGVCLVNQLDGDPRPGCVVDDEPPQFRKCPTDSEIEHSVYCSCRCDAPEGEPECECPSGFMCEPMFQDAPAGIRGGYCIRNDT